MKYRQYASTYTFTSVIMKKRDPFLMNEMDHKFGKIVFFSKQYTILEFRKCFLTALVFTFDIPQIVSPGILTDSRI